MRPSNYYDKGMKLPGKKKLKEKKTLHDVGLK